MADCCEEARQLMTSTSDMFVIVDDDLDVVTRTMSFRRCPVIRPVHGLRRSFVERSSNSSVSSLSRECRTTLNNFTTDNNGK